MKYKLTEEEIEIENAAEKFAEFNDEEKNELDEIISNANLKKAITLRINENDLERIKSAGFNTIRTWNPYPDWVLELAKGYDLMVIQGISLDHRRIFTDNGFFEKQLAELKNAIEKSKKFDNIIMYLVMNEPHAKVIEKWE